MTDADRTEDLVRRLRSPLGNFDHPHEANQRRAQALCTEAANEIERLGEVVLMEIAKRLPVETSGRRETAWLVEDSGDRACPRYRTMDQTGAHWTDDANKAIRFARRADAEMFAAGDEDAWRITEHQWVAVDGDSIHAVEPAELTKVTK